MLADRHRCGIASKMSQAQREQLRTWPQPKCSPRASQRLGLYLPSWRCNAIRGSDPPAINFGSWPRSLSEATWSFRWQAPMWHVDAIRENRLRHRSRPPRTGKRGYSLAASCCRAVDPESWMAGGNGSKSPFGYQAGRGHLKGTVATASGNRLQSG